MPRKRAQSWETEQAQFPSRLSDIMKEKKVSQETLASAIGVKRQTVSLYKTGQSSPNAEQICKIAKFFDVSSDWLLGLVDDKSPNIDIRSICRYTGISEEIVKFLLNNQGYPQLDSVGFAPIKYFNRLFSPMDFHSFLITLCAYFLDIDTIREIQIEAKNELTQMQEPCNVETAEFFEEQMSLCCDKWRNEILSQQKEYRYRRFETIDFFTKLLDGVEARECVQQSIRSTEEMCDEFENWEPEFDE